ncbi:MAG: hypothetical protein ACRDZ4_03575 [Egibacteraceae bacterium]
MVTLFFQPSTRTRMSFETAMHRLGGAVVTEANPLVSSSAAKEESLADMMRTVSKHANVIVLRHPNDDDAREGVKCAQAPVINGGWGDWEHPTQALLDLYTLWRTHGSVESSPRRTWSTPVPATRWRMAWPASAPRSCWLPAKTTVPRKR